VIKTGKTSEEEMFEPYLAYEYMAVTRKCKGAKSKRIRSANKVVIVN
jgi:hypothetical protein